MPAPLITVSAVVMRRGDGSILTVRKRGTDRFMLPGGKPEPGEDAAAAAVRECFEELGARLGPDDLDLLGAFRAPAANEDGHEVEGTVFVARSQAPLDLDAAAEIEELRWLDASAVLPGDLAPLLEHRVLPLLRSV